MTTRPRPVPDTVSAPYWAGVERGALVVGDCGSCGRAHHPPEVACPACGAGPPGTRELAGRGTVFAACVVRQAFDAAFREAVPYHLGLVAPDDAPEVRILTNLLGAPTTAPVPVGTPVTVEFVRDADGVVLPQFRVVEA